MKKKHSAYFLFILIVAIGVTLAVRNPILILKTAYNNVGCFLTDYPTQEEISFIKNLKEKFQYAGGLLITNPKLCPINTDFIITNRPINNTLLQPYLPQIRNTQKLIFVYTKDNIAPDTLFPKQYDVVFASKNILQKINNSQKILYNTKDFNKENIPDIALDLFKYITYYDEMEQKVEITLLTEGGLGNQMFAYASGKAYALRWNRKSYLQNNISEVERIFNVPDNIPEKEKYTYSQYTNKTDDTHLATTYDQTCHWCHTRSDLIRIGGYLQSYKNFSDQWDKISKIYTFPDFKTKNNIQLAQEMSKNESVAIHIRAGDYVFFKYPLLYKSLYYKRAVEYIKKKVKNPQFYVFTNDPNMVKETVDIGAPYKIIDWNTGKESFRDMQLMSLAKHNIIANSTFSWWSALLNKNPNKIVIYPDVWLSWNEKWLEDLRVPEWIEIKSGIVIINQNNIHYETE